MQIRLLDGKYVVVLQMGEGLVAYFFAFLYLAMKRDAEAAPTVSAKADLEEADSLFVRRFE
jgi:hypothetical protein